MNKTSSREWNEDDMDVLARALTDPDPERAARGAAEYRTILQGQHQASQAEWFPGQYLWVLEEVNALKTLIWGLRGMEASLSGEAPGRLHPSPPGFLDDAGVRACLRSLESIAARPADLHVRARACQGWLDGMYSALGADGARDSLLRFGEWPVDMLTSGEGL